MKACLNVVNVVLIVSLMACAGPKGDKGDSGTPGLTAQNGENGKDGLNGRDGADGMRITTSKICSYISANLTVFAYEITTFNTGDILVHCSISDSASAYSKAYMYKAGQNGSSTGSCLLTYDIDTADHGFWEFKQGASVTATYSDAGSASNGAVFTLANCTNN